MTAIQNNANWWIQSSMWYDPARMAVKTIVAEDALDSLPGLAAEGEEETEVAGEADNTESEIGALDVLEGHASASAEDAGALDDMIASAMNQLGMIEAAMRQHQANGFTSQYNEQEMAEEENPTTTSFNQSLNGNLQDDPSAAFYATSPSQDRMGLYSLLAA